MKIGRFHLPHTPSHLLTLSLSLLLSRPAIGFAQTPSSKCLPPINIPQDSANIARLKEIDRDIWAPFSEAYAAQDAEKYLALHLPDFIRATGGQRPNVNDLAGYATGVRKNFTQNKASERQIEIAFTFFERVAGPQTATERGIYRYTSVSKDGERWQGYGRFHVFHRRVNGVWKIAVDYDSDEGGTIDAADFEAGLPPGLFAR